MHLSPFEGPGRLRHSERQGIYAVVGVMARYEFEGGLSATLNVNNLFDERYRLRWTIPVWAANTARLVTSCSRFANHSDRARPCFTLAAEINLLNINRPGSEEVSVIP